MDPNPANPANIYTATELAKILRISYPTFQRWKKAGKIKALKTRTQNRYHLPSVLHALGVTQP